MEVNLVVQFFSSMISGILSAEKKAAQFIGGLRDQALMIQDQGEIVSQSVDQTSSQILTDYEASLKQTAQKNLAFGIGFVLVMILLAFLLLYLLKK